MKKIIYFTLFVTLALSLVSCSSPQRRIIGKWKDLSIMPAFNITTFEFLEDGTVYLDGVKAKYTVEKNILTIYMTLFGVSTKEDCEISFKKDSFGEMQLLLQQPTPRGGVKAAFLDKD